MRPYRPMAAALHFERMVREMNEWKIDCTGDDDCIICKEAERLIDILEDALSATEETR